MRQMTIKKAAIFCLILFSATSVAVTAYAGDTEKGTKEKVNIWTKDHTLDVGTPKKSEGRIDGRGVIDIFDPQNNTIVVDDSQKILSNDIKYFKDDGRRADDSDFTKGKLVGWVLGPDRKIIRLYLIEKKENKGP